VQARLHIHRWHQTACMFFLSCMQTLALYLLYLGPLYTRCLYGVFGRNNLHMCSYIRCAFTSQANPYHYTLCHVCVILGYKFVKAQARAQVQATLETCLLAFGIHPLFCLHICPQPHLKGAALLVATRELDGFHLCVKKFHVRSCLCALCVCELFESAVCMLLLKRAKRSACVNVCVFVSVYVCVCVYVCLCVWMLFLTSMDRRKKCMQFHNRPATDRFELVQVTEQVLQHLAGFVSEQHK